MEKLKVKNADHLKKLTMGSRIVLQFGEKSIVEISYASARELLFRCLNDGYAMYWTGSSSLYAYLQVEKT